MTKSQRLILIIAILGSFVAFLDGAVVNVALPAIAIELGGGLAAQQWIVNAYLLTLGSFILIAGSISDLFGRKKVFAAGLVGFGIASVLCALAPNSTFLIIVRSVQGVAGAMLVPSSLALITSHIQGKSFSRGIGLWTAWTGIAFVIGPLVGGFFTDNLSWRLIFAINILPIALTLFLMTKMEKEKIPAGQVKVDFWGGLLCALGLGGIVYALIEQPARGWDNPMVWIAFLGGLILLAGFFWHERRTRQPMLPLELFTRRNFAVGNLATLLIYAGLSAMTLVLVLFLQQVSGYSAFYSGLSLLPITLIMFFLSSRIGGFAEKWGPRWFMALGPIIAAAGLLYIALNIDAPANYWGQILPGLVIFGIGLSLTVTPLTAAILGDADSARSGIASAVNNAVARIAGLLAIAAIGTILTAQFASALSSQSTTINRLRPAARNFLQQSQSRPLLVEVPPELSESDRPIVESALKNASVQSFRWSMSILAGLVALGGVISGVGIRNKSRKNA